MYRREKRISSCSQGMIVGQKKMKKKKLSKMYPSGSNGFPQNPAFLGLKCLAGKFKRSSHRQIPSLTPEVT